MTTQPFVVPTHDRLLCQCQGKRQATVLVVESMGYTVRLCEYTQPLIYGRFWDYESANEAIVALAHYLADDRADEPDGWRKAVDFVGGYRVRPARIGADGERMVTTDPAEPFRSEQRSMGIEHAGMNEEEPESRWPCTQ